MRRLLIVGLEVPNFPSMPWAEWPSANPLDYQGLLLDFRDGGFVSHQGIIVAALLALVNNGHTAYILLPASKGSSAPQNELTVILYYRIHLDEAHGQTLNMRHDDPFFEAYKGALTGHDICFRFQQMAGPQGWPITDGVVDNVSRLICCKVASIYVLHPPAKKLEQKALKVIIEHFKPDPPPLSGVARPSWVDAAASAIPGVATLQGLRASVTAEIQKKRDELSAHEEKLRTLTGWADLLCLEGLALEAKVIEALRLLGISARTENPSGHSSDLVADESGTRFVFEVTGTTGTIGIEKGRQLMQWVAGAPDPANSKGVLVANAFRNEPPDKRPPTPDRRVFVVELERLAARYHMALLDVRELFRLVCCKLSGQTVDKSVVLDGLLTDGIIRFQI